MLIDKLIKVFLFIGLFLIFPLGQLGRLDLINREVVLHANDIFVGLVAGFWLIKSAIGLLRGRKFSPTPLVVALLVWLIAVVLSLIFNQANYTSRDILISALYGVRWFAYGLFLFAVKNIITKDDLRKSFLVILTAVTFSGLAQYLLLPDTIFLYSLGWDDHYYRLVGTFLDPGFTGIILLAGIIYLYFQINDRQLTGVFWKVLLTFSYVAMALTYSRATFVSFVAAFVFIGIMKKSAKIVTATIIIMAMTLTFLPRTFGEGTNLDRGYSAWGRINNWKETINVWSRSPIIGVGFGTYRYETNAPKYSHAGAGADSSLLLILATTGLVGLVAYLNVWRVALFPYKSLLFASTFLAIFTHSWFNNTLMYAWAMEWLWLIAAYEGIKEKT